MTPPRAAAAWIVLLLAPPLASCGGGRPALPARTAILIAGDGLDVAGIPALGLERDEGIRFDDLVSPAASPDSALASLLTGLLPPRHGVRRPGDAPYADVVWLPERLAEAGIASLVVRSSGLPEWTESGASLTVALEEAAAGAEATGAAPPWLSDPEGPRLILILADRDAGGSVAATLDALAGDGILRDAAVAAVAIPGGAGPSLRDADLQSLGFLRLPRGRRGEGSLEVPAGLADLLPTLFAILGTEPPDGLDGKSLLPALAATGPPPRRDLYSEWIGPDRFRAALRRSPWKLVVEWDEDHRLVSRTLRNLRDDPDEIRDVASDHTGVAGGLAARLERILAADRNPRRAASGLRTRFSFTAEGLLEPPESAPSPVLVPRRPGTSVPEARRERAVALLRRLADGGGTEALAELGRLGNARARALDEALAGGDPHLARTALEVIRRDRDRRAFPSVLRCWLDSGEEARVGDALVTLVTLDRDRLGRELDRLATDPDPRRRRAAALGYRTLPASERLSPLLDLLRDGDPGVRGAAAASLEGFRDAASARAAITALLETLERDLGVGDVERSALERSALEAYFQALRGLTGSRSGLLGTGPAGPESARILATPETARRWLESFRDWWREAQESWKE